MTDIKTRARELLTCDELRGRLPEEVQALLRDIVAFETKGRYLPEIPTPEMDAAGKAALSDNGVDNVDDCDALVCYAAMWNAAPRSPQ